MSKGNWLNEHQTKIIARVYYEDTDAGGVVYHARYLHFMERARTEWLRECGLEQQKLKSEQQRVFVVTDATLQWIAPARLDDEILITAKVASTTAATVIFEQKIFRIASGGQADNSKNTLLTTAEVRAACVGSEDWKPKRLPLL